MKELFTELIENDITFETERLLINPLKLDLESFQDLYEIYSSDSNVFGYCQPHPNFMYTLKYLRDKVNVNQQFHKIKIIYVYRLKETNKIIGLRSIMPDIRPSCIPEELIEFNTTKNIITETIINQNYWNLGLSNEGSKQIYKELKTKGIHNILTFVYKSNLKAKNLNLKLGFEKVNLPSAITKYGYFKECVNNTLDVDKQNIYIKQLNTSGNSGLHQWPNSFIL